MMPRDIPKISKSADRLLLALCLLLSVAMLSLNDSRQEAFAGHLNRFLTYPYYKFTDFIEDVGRVRAENNRLQARIVSLETNALAVERLRRDRDELRQALGFVNHGNARLSPCEVVKRTFTESASLVLVRFPSSVPLRPYQPIMSIDGLAGRVKNMTGPNTAWVELLTSPGMALCSEIPRTGLPGILRPVDGQFELAMIGRDEDVQVGDKVVTSDIAAIYPSLESDPFHAPRGIPIGEVVFVDAPPEKIFKVVRVKAYSIFSKQTVLFAVFGDGDWLIPAVETVLPIDETQEDAP
jgi:cell shape-determining protein MreC